MTLSGSVVQLKRKSMDESRKQSERYGRYNYLLAHGRRRDNQSVEGQNRVLNNCFTERQNCGSDHSDNGVYLMGYISYARVLEYTVLLVQRDHQIIKRQCCLAGLEILFEVLAKTRKFPEKT